LSVFPGEYDYFQPSLIKIFEMISYVYLPGFAILILFNFFKNLLVKSNKYSKLNY